MEEVRREGVLAASRRLAGHEPTLWALVAVALVGDVALTAWGLSLDLVETNPLGAVAIARFGVAGMVAVKAAAVALALAWWHVLPLELGRFVPLLLAIPWWIACVSNLVLVVTVVH